MALLLKRGSFKVNIGNKTVVLFHYSLRDETGEDDQRLLPADIGKQRTAKRGEQELPERTGGRPDPESERALFCRNTSSKGGQHEGKRRKGDPEANKDTRRDMQGNGALRVDHEQEACHVEHGAECHRLPGAVAVGHHAGKRLPDSPDEVLDGNRERKDLPAPVPGVRHRLEKQSHCRAGAEGNKRNQASADDDERDVRALSDMR